MLTKEREAEIERTHAAPGYDLSGFPDSTTAVVRELLAEVRRLRKIRAVAQWLAKAAPEEQAFVEDLVKNPANYVSLEIFADWLEDRGRLDQGRRIRLLCPQTGDVLVLRSPPGHRTNSSDERVASRIRAELLRRGRDCFLVVMPDGWDLERIPKGARLEAGLYTLSEIAEMELSR